MAHKRHEIPTHLNVEDRAFYGLSARQATCLIAGISGSYGLWSQWPDLASPLRLGLACTCFVIAAAFALLRPGGRGLEEWAFIALHYAVTPKVALWRPAKPDAFDWQPGGAGWHDLDVRLDWKEAGR